MSATQLPVIPRAVCVYCASSKSCAPLHHEDAFRLGELLAKDGRTVIYGGSKSGSMGAVANGALAAGGQVIGVLPNFLADMELAHDALSELMLVDDMRTRKHLMLSRSEAIIALPGGTGTFEELLETLTLKRLGLWTGPVIVVNRHGYYEPLRQLLESAIAESFMARQHADMWVFVDTVEEAVTALETAPGWSSAARSFAAV
ncbi:MAG: hypothetical protein RJB26_969 [Pseudomonadota bacterium]